MTHWEAIESPTHPHAFAVALVEEVEQGVLYVERTLPLEFTGKAEAERAAARLNIRDRQEHVAELRGKGLPVLDADAPAPDLDPERDFG